MQTHSDINRREFMKMMNYGVKDIDSNYFDNLRAPCTLGQIFGPTIHSFADYALKIRNNPKMIRELNSRMSYFGFTCIGNGFNRYAYINEDLPTLVVKISTTSSAKDDAKREMKNQFVLKPYCTKTFEAYPGGAIGLFERVSPLNQSTSYDTNFIFGLNRFYDIIDKDNVLMNDIADVKNFGVRSIDENNSTLVILDYPYVYRRNHDITCRCVSNDGSVCGGKIKYSTSVHCIWCDKCHTVYQAQDAASLVDQIFLGAETLRNPDLEYTIVNTKTGEIRYDSRKGKMDNFMKP